MRRIVMKSGLSSGEAQQRLRESGPNQIHGRKRTSVPRLAARQFASPVIGLLVAAAIVAAVVGERANAAAIAAILAINAAIGFLQEHRAERAVLALRSMTARRARVVRDGQSLVVPADTIVPGDLMLLDAGDVVAADARLLHAHALTANEAALTGESTPADKHVEPSRQDTPLAERHDVVFMGSAISSGSGLAEVTATGMRTELGRIAHLLESVEDAATPLQRRLAHVSGTLLYICGGIVALVAAAGALRGWPPMLTFVASVSLAVAAVPEGLPAIVTVALAVGVQRMAARRVLVRRLAAVETLGCTTVICTDKTGTLTTGAMRVRELWGGDHVRLLFAAAACCDAELTADGTTGTGDPTEVAILLDAAARGIERAAIESTAPRVSVDPFDPLRKVMSITRADGRVYIKGAFESVAALCGNDTAGAHAANLEMAGRGLRVLAVAVAEASEGAAPRAALLGLIALADPPRTEAIDAIAAARRAGIATVMITGDHPVTAHAIAKEMGIREIDGAPHVHARATPEDKLRIIREWKTRGAVVAMTGDGVNDAPALREADVGIAMGRSGTEVTREAADVVLADDNFADIVAAVREGRGIFDNVRKTLVYLLSGNAGELTVMFVAAVAGLPLPLLPLHLLWINVVTDGLPALALVLDPVEDDVMERRPRRPDEPMLGAAQWRSILATGMLEAAVTLTVFIWTLRSRDLTYARSFAFSVLVFAELFRAFAARSATRLFWQVGAFTNLRLVGVVIMSASLQVATHLVPALRHTFGLASLSIGDAALVLLAGLVPVTIIEASKILRASEFSRRTASRDSDRSA